MPSVTVVIPALDEERALPGTLAALAGEPVAHEVIVVDGGSRDDTAAVARSCGATLLAAPAGRARQMNVGAAHASAPWLLFLHADTRLPEGALQAIVGQPEGVEAGCFRHSFDGGGTVLRFIAWLHNRRARATGVMYGDQALFVRREVFRAIGGFPPGELEDVDLSRRLLARSRPVILPLTVVTSARKFAAHGPLRSLARVLLILAQHRLGLKPRLGRRFFDPVR